MFLAPLGLGFSYCVCAVSRPSEGCDLCGHTLAANPAGAVTFVFCVASLGFSANTAAIAAVTLTFVFRILTITFNWRTAPVASGSIFEGDETNPPTQT